MKDEQTKTIKALRLALQMEIDGEEYYRKASQKSDNKIGRDLFQWLAAEEDKHRRRFEEIYKSIETKRTWPKISIQPGKRERVRTLFAEAMETTESHLETRPAELDAIAKAISMENKTHDFYKSRSQIATQPAERSFYEALAAEEKSHYLVLIDYREYFLDPAGWFRKTEHHSLDGG